MTARKPKPPVAPSTELATLPPLERAAQVLKFDEVSAKLVTLAESSSRIVEIRDEVSRDECHAAKMELKRTRVAIEKSGKEARDDANKFAKAVIVKEDELIAIIAKEENRLSGIQSAWDGAREREKEAARKIEEDRIRKENAALEAMRNLPVEMIGWTSKAIFEASHALMDRDLATEFDESALPRALEIRTATVDKLANLMEAAEATERLQAQLAAERAENARQRAQEAERLAQATRELAEAEEARRVAAKAEDDARAERAHVAAMDSEHIQDIRDIPLQWIGKRVTDEAIAELEALDPSCVIKNTDALEVARQAKATALQQLRDMRAAQLQGDIDRKAREAAERVEAEQRRAAEEAERQAAQAARLAELRASAPPLAEAAIDAAALLAANGFAKDDVTLRLYFAIERDVKEQANAAGLGEIVEKLFATGETEKV